MLGKLRSGTANLTGAGTAQAIVTTSTVASGLVFRARDGNTGNLYVGDSTIDNTGPPITPGTAIGFSDKSEFDLADIYFDGGTTNDDLDFWYMVP
tara:strand:- start:6983 stop:7267 length:285 start_codon:yes stop_codon:yes gene_type:complete